MLEENHAVPLKTEPQLDLVADMGRNSFVAVLTQDLGHALLFEV